MNKLSIFYLFVFCTLLLAGGCTDDGCLSDTDTPVFLQPSFSTASNVSARSIVNETGTATGQVDKIGVYLTRTDGYTAYADPAMVYTTFTTKNGTTWTGAKKLNLRTEQARLYAWYPDNGTAPTESGTTRTIPLTLPAAQNFDGTSTTACSQTDYLYGSANKTAGDATAITVSATNNTSPTVYLQHALAQLVFTIEYKAGRVPDSEYDYVKSISLTTGTGTAVFRAANAAGTLALNDGTIILATTATITFTATAGTSQLPGNIGAPKPVAYGLVAPKAKDATGTNPISLNLVLGQKSASTNDRTLTAANAALFNGEWKKGHRYTYNLQLDKNDITLKSVEIKAWTENNGGSQDVPPVIE